MSLAKFLVAGKSVLPVKDENSRYRMTGAGRVPKFGGANNPFATPTADPEATSHVVEVHPVQTVRAVVPVREAVVAAPTPVRANLTPVSNPADPQLELGSVVTPVAAAVEADVPSPIQPTAGMSSEVRAAKSAPTPVEVLSINLGASEVGATADHSTVAGWSSMMRFLSVLNPLNWFKSRKQDVFGTGVAVQPELSLETVRVMRNDLSDTDMEVRPSILKPGARVPAWKEPPAKVGTVAQKLRKPRVSSQFAAGDGNSPK